MKQCNPYSLKISEVDDKCFDFMRRLPITFRQSSSINNDECPSQSQLLNCLWCGFTTRAQMNGHDHLMSLQWRHDGRDSVSNHQPRDCLLNRLFRRRSKKASKLRVTGLCAGNSPGTGEFPAQMTSNAENVSIWWRHHVEYWRQNQRGDVFKR